MVQEVGLWPSAMVRLAPHWHAVKWAAVIAFAICTVGYLYLQSIATMEHVRCRAEFEYVSYSLFFVVPGHQSYKNMVMCWSITR